MSVKGPNKNIRLKTMSIVLIFLIMLYYQKWVFVIFYELVKNGQLSLIPDDGSLIEVEEVEESYESSAPILRASGEKSGEKLELPKRIFSTTSPEVEEALRNLSNQVQTSLQLLQRNDNDLCTRPKLFCGSPIDCGIGCQIHKVAICLMISYATNRTLILDWSNWPYTDPNLAWVNMFNPVGSSCPVENESTAFAIWSRTGIRLSEKESSSYPFRSGVPIPKEIGEVLKRNDIDPIIWWIGQFVKFVLQPQPWQNKLIETAKSQMKFSPNSPTVGILIRRRDKTVEYKKTSQSIDRYLTLAKRFFGKYESQLPYNVTSLKRRVYFATDDRNLLKLAQKRYRSPRWEILGVQIKSEPDDVIKDLFLLSECNFVLCSFSSEICRLVLELMEYRDPNAINRIKSLDHKYFFDLPGIKGAGRKGYTFV